MLTNLINLTKVTGMEGLTLLTTRPFSAAKSGLSAVMDQVVRGHRPQLVERNDWKEAMALIGLDDLRSVVSTFRFDPKVTYGDEVVMTLDQMGLVASGRSLDAAADAMVLELRHYCAEYIDRFDHFRHTARLRDLPWMLRFSLSPETQQRELLFEEPPATGRTQGREGSPAAR